MKFFAASLRLLGLPLKRRPRVRRGEDFADMGTALGLDASTTLDADSMEGLVAQTRSSTVDRLQLRLHRRSSF